MAGPAVPKVSGFPINSSTVQGRRNVVLVVLGGVAAIAVAKTALSK